MRAKTALARWFDADADDEAGSAVVAVGAALLLVLAMMLYA